MRLRIAPAPTAAPTPEIAAKIEDWHAQTRPLDPPIVVPVAPPAKPGPSLPEWLARWWPGVFAPQIPLAAYVLALDAQGFNPVEPVEHIQPWAYFAARGYFELDWAARRGTSGIAPRPITGAWAGPPRGPLDQYSALVVQARGPSDPNARAAVMAWANYYHPADSLVVYAALQKPDWTERLAALAD